MIIKLISTCIFAIAIAFNISVYGQVLNKPRQVIVTGKIESYEPDKQLLLYVNKVGFGNDAIVARVDSNGNFLATFSTYTPTDVRITYKSNFLILVHPGDSLYIKFDGRYVNRKDVLKTVTVNGLRAKTNVSAINFQQRYWQYWDVAGWNKIDDAVKNYDEKRYLLRLDAIKQGFNSLYNQFLADEVPDAESRVWSKAFADIEYYTLLAYYAVDHREANQMGFTNNWDVSKGFFNGLSGGLPVKDSMLISGYAIQNFVSNTAVMLLINKKTILMKVPV